ncbi:Sec63 [Rhizophlyctis rosea]|uniref:Sec63 n=1 Tax=Rhizophlyctis rosea TaxID=64517 RepID=A0AAD5S9H6_9FUNG|nr:Sec63 [Rhizophlyctis rosea]
MTHGLNHPFVKTKNHFERLRTLKARLQDKKLGELVLHGVAFHHGGKDEELHINDLQWLNQLTGLDYADRHLIEEHFVDSTTSTLAVGVNLPAHLVIIKNTVHYTNGQQAEYSELDIMQMLGRAGRPQFDDSGVAVIMTSMEKKRKYEALLMGAETIESSLHENLIEHLNAEVVLGSIASFPLAIEWLKATVRIQKNPGYYKLKNCTAVEGRLSAEHRLEGICMKDLQLLQNHELVVTNQGTKKLEASEYGKAMAKYYIKYQTTIKVLQMPPKASLATVLETLCAAEEFAEIRFHQDKMHLSALNKHESIRFPLKNKRVSTVAQKVNLLIQCALGTVPFTEQKTAISMSQDTTLILPHATRVARFIIEICQIKEDVVSLRSALDLSRCLTAKTWENSPLLLKQIDTIGPALAKMMANNGIRTFKKLFETDPRRIEVAANRYPPFGNKVLELAGALPQLQLKISQFKDLSRPTSVELYVEVSLRNAASVRVNGKRGQYSVIFVAGTSDNVLIDFKRFFMGKVKEGINFRIRTTMTKANQRILCSLMPEEFVGLDVHKEVVPDIKPIHFRMIQNARPAVMAKQQRTPSAGSLDGWNAPPKPSTPVAPAPAGADRPPQKLFRDDSPSVETDYDLHDDVNWSEINIDDMLKDIEEAPPLPPPLRFNSGAAPAQLSQRNVVQNSTHPSRELSLQQRNQSHSQPQLRPPSAPSQYRRPAAKFDAGSDDDSGSDIFDLSHHIKSQPKKTAVPEWAQTQSTNARNLEQSGEEGVLANGNVPCAHKCKKKSRCTHLCCKIGVPAKTARKRKRHTDNENMDEDSQSGRIGRQKRANLQSTTKWRTHAESDEDDEVQLVPLVSGNRAPHYDAENEIVWSEDADQINHFDRDVSRFVDMEARERKGDDEYDSEIEGEFDGWLVSDSDPISQEQFSSEPVPYEKEKRQREEDSVDTLIAAALDSEEGSPLKRKRLGKRRKVVYSSDEENEARPTQSMDAVAVNQTAGKSPSKAGRDKDLKHVLNLEVSNPFDVRSDLDHLHDLHHRASSSSMKPWQNRNPNQGKAVKHSSVGSLQMALHLSQQAQKVSTDQAGDAGADSAKFANNMACPELEELRKLHESTSKAAAASPAKPAKETSKIDRRLHFLGTPSPSPPASENGGNTPVRATVHPSKLTENNGRNAGLRRTQSGAGQLPVVGNAEQSSTEPSPRGKGSLTEKGAPPTTAAVTQSEARAQMLNFLRTVKVVDMDGSEATPHEAVRKAETGIRKLHDAGRKENVEMKDSAVSLKEQETAQIKMALHGLF